MIALATESEAPEACGSEAWSSPLAPDQGGRSVPVAMPAVSPVALSVADEELAHRIAEDVLVEARVQAADTECPVASSVLWAAVRTGLVESGRHVAAARFAAVRTQRERRLRLMHEAGFDRASTSARSASSSAQSASTLARSGERSDGPARSAHPPRFGADGTGASRGSW